MKKIVFIILLMASSTALGKTTICWSVLAPIDTQVCREIQTPIRHSARAFQFCNGLNRVEEVKECLAVTANKNYKPEDLTFCQEGWYLGSVFSCLDRRGFSFQK